MDYNKVSEEYESFIGQPTEWLIGYNHVAEIFEPIKGKKILDYGCGEGQFSRHLLERGAKVTGVDTSEAMIEKAKKHISTIIYKTIENNNLPDLGQEIFDGAVLNFVTCTIGSQKEILRIFKNIHKLLKKDGLLVMMNLNWEQANGKEFLSLKTHYQPNLKSGDKVQVTLKTKKSVTLTDYFWSKNDYVNLLKKANFKVREIREPLAPNTDHAWIDEKTIPPHLIIVVQKI